MNDGIVTTEFGTGRFGSTSLGYDERPRDNIELRMPGFPPLFGELRTIYHEADRTFDLVIASFGYTDPRYLGMEGVAGAEQKPAYAWVRLKFTVAQRALIQRIIVQLLNDPVAQKKGIPFPDPERKYLRPPPTFTGRITFLPGWILER